MYGSENSFTNGVTSSKNELVDNLKALLTEHVQGIPLTELEDVYKTKFSKSLLNELIKIALPDAFSKFASIIPKDQTNGLSDNIIVLKDQEDNDQIQDPLLQEITASGIVSEEFDYDPNPFISDYDRTFLAFVSNIDRYNQYIFMQPEGYMQYMDKLTEQLDIYYSDPISEKLIVKDIVSGLACVSKFEGVYHRVHIKENHPSKCVIIYVDLGLTEEVEKAKIQFKHLLKYFASLPRMAITCRLVDIEFKLDNYQMSPELYKELYDLCQSGPFYVNAYDQVNGVLNVKIYDADQRCLNDIVVEKGLVVEAVEPLAIATGNDEDQRKTQHLPSFVDSKQKSFNDIHGTNNTSKTDISNQNRLMDDYEEDTNVQTQSTVTRIPDSIAYDDYEMENSSPTSNGKRAKHKVPASNSTIKSGRQSDRKKPTIIKNSNSTNQHNQRGEQHNENRKPFTITINRDIPGARLFNSALSGLSRNKASNPRQISRSIESTTLQKTDEFANWMCSWSIEQSLWSSSTYKNALLKYIGRIYQQGAHMYRFFAQLKDEISKLDELDLLNKLIENTKQRHAAKMSFDKWKDAARINRRLEDLKIIFEFNGNYTYSNHPFNITPTGLREIIDTQTIRSYFDLGCGDGTITAGIGAYLGLTKENIFGGDIYEGQSEEITFIKVNEHQATIALPDNRVDLITSFVTFHHVSQLKKTLNELARILRPGGYLILREHDCRNEHILSAKYLNFVHAIMMIAGVGEFAESSSNHNHENQHALNGDYENNINSWPEKKSRIIDYTKTIHYRTCDELQQELGSVGFHLRATLYYGANGSDNPQKLFYGVYQLNNK